MPCIYHAYLRRYDHEVMYTNIWGDLRIIIGTCHSFLPHVHISGILLHILYVLYSIVGARECLIVQ